MLLTDLVTHSYADARSFGPITAAKRSVRSLPLLLVADDVNELESMPSFRDHVLSRADGNRYFYATGDLLYHGLPRAERVNAVLHHYRFERKTFTQEFEERVYGEGLEVWSADATGPHLGGGEKSEHFSLTLGPPRHNLNEGALCLTLRVGEQGVRLMSFSLVDGTTLGSSPGTELFIARHQGWWTTDGDSSIDLGHQPLRHDDERRLGSALFASYSAQQMCLAGVAGIAAACGIDSVVGINELVHLAYPKEGSRLAPSYSGCWDAFRPEPVGGVGMRMRLPLDSTPLSDVSSKHRRRARKRRRHWDQISGSAFHTLNALRQRRLPVWTPPDR